MFEIRCRSGVARLQGREDQSRRFQEAGAVLRTPVSARKVCASNAQRIARH
jgi:hypothetical protein